MIERFKPDPLLGLVTYCEVCRRLFETRARFEQGCERCKDARPAQPVWATTHRIE